jgi:hypothetical protein
LSSVTSVPAKTRSGPSRRSASAPAGDAPSSPSRRTVTVKVRATGRLTVGRPQGQSELALAVDERHLLLELHLETLGGPGRDGRDAHREERASRRPAGGRAFARSLFVLLALLQQPGVDALRGQLAVDGPRALLLQDDSGDTDEAVPDREVAHRCRGRQRKPVRPLLHFARVVLVDLPDVDAPVAAGDAHVDGHLAQR